MPSTVTRVLFGVVVVASLVVLFTPGSDVPDVSVSDKLVHGLLFAALAVTGLLAGVPPVRLAVGLLVYAGLSEVLQATLPIHRDGDAKDALTDAAGALVGLLATTVWLRSGRSSGRAGPSRTR